MSSFKNQIWECYLNIPACLFTYCCPCYVYGKVAEAVGESCVVNGCCLMTPCRICFTPQIRGKVREKYGIEGDSKMDCIMHCCCPFCAIVQEANELQENNDMPPGTMCLSRE